MFNEILELTKKLVSIASVNNTAGEKEIACYIERYLKVIPYFKKYNDRVFIQKLDDELDRRNVFALIKGEKGDSKETIILHGHMDTVGVEDFAQLKDIAFHCDELMERLKKLDLDKETKEDLMSGKWLFGRGACDMKSGVAVFMVVMKYLSERVKDIDGNILLSINPVEENLHTGIIKALEVFKNLQDKEKLTYKLAINNDYICPLYEGDKTKYIYTGAVGKLLPCFYIQGKETHVGQCFEGFDASMIASELIREMNLNPDYCNEYDEEYTLPPSVLKMKDLKKHYNVQTSYSSFVYFNYFIHNETIDETMEKLKGAAKIACKNVLLTINSRYKKYCSITSMNYSKIHYDIEILDYKSLVALAKEAYCGDLNKYINDIRKKAIAADMDKREASLEIVKKLMVVVGIKKPTIVIFFAAPYCPHNTLMDEVNSERNIYNDINTIAEKVGAEEGESYEMMRFFPSLSDSSYLKIDDDNSSIDKLIDNFPEYKKLYNVPIKEIKKLNIPAINYGCFGKDAHKWTERVYMPYSFEVLPKLIVKTIEHYFVEQ